MTGSGSGIDGFEHDQQHKANKPRTIVFSVLFIAL